MAEISPILMFYFFAEINLANKDIFTEIIAGMAAELTQLCAKVGLLINRPARLKNPNGTLGSWVVGSQKSEKLVGKSCSFEYPFPGIE